LIYPANRLEVFFANAVAVVKRQLARACQYRFDGVEKTAFKMRNEMKLLFKEVADVFVLFVKQFFTAVAVMALKIVATTFTGTHLIGHHQIY
jgi:hypothetical protein